MLKPRRIAVVAALFTVIFSALCRGQSDPLGKSSLRILIYDRTRVDSWQWFTAPPYSSEYGYVESLVRLGLAQRLGKWGWELELAQPSVLNLPDSAVSSDAAQGQLGLGGTYDAANRNIDPTAAFFKQGFARYNGEKLSLRLGRRELFDGQEIHAKNAAVAWLQANRIAQRLVGNFGFSNAQRSFDGLDAHLLLAGGNMTVFAARADQGVYNMNGNPELNVDVQYVAFVRSAWKQRILWRAFALGYHDGRTGVIKTDNRALAVRAADHRNIRIGTYGGDFLAVAPLGRGTFDLLFWGSVQNGQWGALNHRANAAALEGGYQFRNVPTAPWLRGGWFRSSGDNNPNNDKHSTFFQVLPTPRVYARLPFYNLMNNTDDFVQLIDKPLSRLALRSDLHWLQLSSNHDLWYQGGGAFDNKVFGYVGRPAGGFSSLASVADLSADWRVTTNIALNFYYAHAQGKTVVEAIYPMGHNMQYGFAEVVYSWGNSARGGAPHRGLLDSVF